MVSKYLHALVFQVQCPSLNGSPRWAAAHFQDDDRLSSSSCSCSVRHHLWPRQQPPRLRFSNVFVTFCDILCTVNDICDTFYWSNSVLHDMWRLCFFTVLTTPPSVFGDVSLGSFSALPGVILFNAEYRFLLRSSFFGGEELLVLEVCSIKLACSRRERFWALHFIGRVWRLVEPVTKTMRPVTCGRSSCCNYKYKHNPIQIIYIQIHNSSWPLWLSTLGRITCCQGPIVRKPP